MKTKTTKANLIADLQNIIKRSNDAYLALHGATMFAEKTPAMETLKKTFDDLRVAIVAAKNN
jgi:hypothetical protein